MINDYPIYEDVLLGVEKAKSIPIEQTMQVRRVAATMLKRYRTGEDGSGDNSIRVHVKDAAEKGGNYQLANAKVQIRLIRSSRYGLSTLFEYIINGNKDGVRALSYQLFLEDPTKTPAPIVGEKAKRVAAKFQDEVISVTRLPLLSKKARASLNTLAAAEIPNAVELVNQTLLESARGRQQAGDVFEEIMNALDAPDPNAFDVRTPFFANVSAAGTSADLTELAVIWGDTRVKTVDHGTLGDGDELAVRLALRAGVAVKRDDFSQPFDFALFMNRSDKPAGGGTCTASLSAGFEWARRIVGEKTIFGAAKEGTSSFEQRFFLSDVLTGD
ncbi:MAG: hypothetical protein ACREDR_06015 [Blastocatellia bacterium]